MLISDISSDVSTDSSKFLVKQDVEILLYGSAQFILLPYCYHFLFYIYFTSCRKLKQNRIFLKASRLLSEITSYFNIEKSCHVSKCRISGDFFSTLCENPGLRLDFRIVSAASVGCFTHCFHPHRYLVRPSDGYDVQRSLLFFSLKIVDTRAWWNPGCRWLSFFIARYYLVGASQSPTTSFFLSVYHPISFLSLPRFQVHSF